MGKEHRLGIRSFRPVFSAICLPGVFAILSQVLSISVSQAQLTITQQPVSMNVGRGGTAVFELGCSAPVTGYELLNDGAVVRSGGLTSGRIVLTNVQTSDAGNFSIRVTNATSEATSSNVTLAVGNLVTWGLRSEALARLMPLDLTNSIGASLNGGMSGYAAFLGFGSDRVVRGWGETYSGPVTNLPGTMPRAFSVHAETSFALLLGTNGTVFGWPAGATMVTKIPPGLTNVLKLAASSRVALALLDNGRVVCWRSSGSDTIASNLVNVVDIAAGFDYGLAVMSDGTVTSWTSTPPAAALPKFTNVLAVSSGENHYLALKQDGSVLAGGLNNYGEATVPAGLTNIVAVAAGEGISMALDEKGKVCLWGRNSPTYMAPPNTLSNVISILAGYDTAAALVNNGQPCITIQPRSRAVQQDQPFTLSVRAVSPNGLLYQWYQNETAIQNATNKDYTVSVTQVEDAGSFYAVVSDGSLSCTSSIARVEVLGPLNLRIWGSPSTVTAVPFGLTNVVAVSAWSNAVVALRDNGIVAAWGANPPGLLKTNTLAVSTGATAVAAGWEHGLALQSNGTILAWPAFPTPQAAMVPAAATNIVAVAAGEKHSVALNSSGKVLVWGAWPLGVSIQPPTNLPPAVAIAAGDAFSMALATNRTVVCWGQNTSTTLAPPADLQDVEAIAAGKSHALALTRQGRVIAWGDTLNNKTTVPVSATNIIAIAAGINHSLALRDDGEIIAWGATGPALITPPGLSNVVGLAVTASNSIAVIGTGEPIILGQPSNETLVAGNSLFLAARVAGQQPISYQWYHNGIAIEGGTNRTLVMTRAQVDSAGNYTFIATNAMGSVTSRDVQVAVNPSRSVAAWGNNGYGQAIAPLDVQGAIKVAAGSYHSLAIRSNGTVAAWGRNDYAQCAVPQTLSNVVDIAASEYFSLALTSQGKVQGWGETNVERRTSSLGEITKSSNLQAVNQRGPVKAIAAGYTHAIALYNGGTVYTWGINSSGYPVATPAGLWDIKAVAAGDRHCAVLRSNGTVFCWLTSTFPLTDPLTAVPPDLTNVVSIAASAFHTLALKSDGTVVGWGSEPELFTPPADLTNVVAITAGRTLSAALTSDGRLVTWGWPYLDCEDYSNRSVPETLTHVSSISIGSGHALAITGDPKPAITQHPQGRSLLAGQPLVLSTTATGQGQLSYQWHFNGEAIPTATNASITVSNISQANYGSYHVIVTNLLSSSTSRVAHIVPGEILGWGRLNTSEQLLIPTSATNVTAIGAGVDHVVALRKDGTVVVWGYVKPSQVSAFKDIKDGALVSAGLECGLVVHSNGTMTTWSWTGEINHWQFDSPIISAELTSIGVGFASRADGSAFTWGSGSETLTNAIATLSHVTKVYAGERAAFIAAHKDGSFTPYGDPAFEIWPGLKDVVDFDRFLPYYIPQPYCFALLADQTVVGVRSSYLSPLSGFTNIVAIADGNGMLGLRSDGTLAYSGWTFPPPINLSNIVEIASGDYDFFIRFGDGSPSITAEPYDRIITAGSNALLSAFAVGQPPLTYQWQRNGENIQGATNFSFLVTGALGSEGSYRCIIENSLGSVTSKVSEVSIYYPPPTLTVIGDPTASQTNGFTFSVQNLKGQGATVLYGSSNLVDWLPIHTNPPGATAFEIQDPSWTNSAQRFFRASEER